MKGKIMYDNIWQAKAVNVAEQQKTSLILHKTCNKLYIYVGAKVGSSYVASSNSQPITCPPGYAITPAGGCKAVPT